MTKGRMMTVPKLIKVAALVLTLTTFAHAASARYVESDPIGLAAGPSTYGYVAGNPLKSIDPSGLDLLVMVGNKIPGLHQPGGHAAIAVEGKGVWSFGNNTDLGSSTTEYLRQQIDLRDNTITRIRTSPEQDAAALRYLRQFTKKNGVEAFPDNCANRVNGALSAAGIPLQDPRSFPFAVLKSMMSLEELGAASGDFIPQYGEMPEWVGQFNPRPQH